jgi:gamma-glutamyl-gamma-aminobutyrate hydrolase PuuD
MALTQNGTGGTTADNTAAYIRELLAQSQAESRVSDLRPLVLVPGYLTSAQTARWPVYGSDAAGIDFLRLAGASPLPLPSTPLIEGNHFDILTNDAAFAEAFSNIWSYFLQMEVRGLFLAGGGDLSSPLYGQSPHPQTDDPLDLWRDLRERYLVLIAWLLHMPTFGACRGMQHMNIALGGGLIQDLRGQWRALWEPYARQFGTIPPLQRHRELGRFPTPDTFSTHPIKVDPQSLLGKLVQLGTPACAASMFDIDEVLSQHHQIVGFVLPDQRIVGYLAQEHRVNTIAFDGVIEGFEAVDTGRFWLGVQFHPEWMQHVSWARGIFSGFVTACQRYTPLSRAQLQELRPAVQAWVRKYDQKAFGWAAMQGICDQVPSSHQTAGSFCQVAAGQKPYARSLSPRIIAAKKRSSGALHRV